MSFSGMQYADMGARIGVYAAAQFLVHAQPDLILERFAQAHSIPKNKSQVIKWRRLVPFDAAMDALVEGITPSPTGVRYEDVQGQVQQYGAWIPFTDVLIETHEDENLKMFTTGAAEQAALTKERILWNMMIAGVNVIYSGTATSRDQVIAPVSAADLQLAPRAPKYAFAKPITNMLNTSPKMPTQPLAPAYVRIDRTDLEQDLRNITGFVPREN